jgi:hypothetical protein
MDLIPDLQKELVNYLSKSELLNLASYNGDPEFDEKTWLYIAKKHFPEIQGKLLDVHLPGEPLYRTLSVTWNHYLHVKRVEAALAFPRGIIVGNERYDEEADELINERIKKEGGLDIPEEIEYEEGDFYYYEYLLALNLLESPKLLIHKSIDTISFEWEEQFGDLGQISPFIWNDNSNEFWEWLDTYARNAAATTFGITTDISNDQREDDAVFQLPLDIKVRPPNMTHIVLPDTFFLRAHIQTQGMSIFNNVDTLEISYTDDIYEEDETKLETELKLLANTMLDSGMKTLIIPPLDAAVDENGDLDIKIIKKMLIYPLKMTGIEVKYTYMTKLTSELINANLKRLVFGRVNYIELNHRETKNIVDAVRLWELGDGSLFNLGFRLYGNDEDLHSMMKTSVIAESVIQEQLALSLSGKNYLTTHRAAYEDELASYLRL